MFNNGIWKSHKRLKNSQENNSETVPNKNGKKNLKKFLKKDIYIYLEERKKNIDNLDFNIIIV